MKYLFVLVACVILSSCGTVVGKKAHVHSCESVGTLNAVGDVRECTVMSIRL